MSGFFLDYIFKKILLLILNNIIFNKYLIISEKYFIEFLTKKLYKIIYYLIYKQNFIINYSKENYYSKSTLLCLLSMLFIVWNYILNLLF